MMKNAFAALLFALSLRADAADLPAWMKGSWRGEMKGVAIEEHWTDGRGALMTGMHRELRPDGTAEFEFLRIEKKGDSLVYLAMPYAHPATPFPLKSMTSDRVVFENLTHDFPQRIIYWRDGARLCARAEATVKGSNQGEEWCWTRFEQ